MRISNFIIFLIIGALAGWIAGQITKGSGFGVLGNIIVGIVGAFLGGLCLNILGIAAYGILGQLIFAVIGALLFIWLLGFIRK
jgi:uncharacterized membrane protein YeaQ/YmgE (transglycosylase-associated protein family)